MKTATVTAYLNTGYTGINVPDSPAIIENNYQSKNLQVINCLPLSGQVNVSIRVKAYDELHETDYIKLQFSGDNTTYWAKVDGYVYLTSDTVEIALTMDYWLTLGGINNVSSISGITKRVHVAKADDQLFAFTEPDEMINPAKPLKSVCDSDYDMSFINDYPYKVDSNGDYSPTGTPKDVIVLLSTLDLYAIGRLYETDVDDNGNMVENAMVLSKDFSYTDPDTQQTVTKKETVTIPKLYTYEDVDYDNFVTKWGLNDSTKYNNFKANPNGVLKGWMPEPDENDWTNGSEKDLTVAGVGYFDASDEWVQKGVAILHNCGVEDALLDQYIIPSDYIDMNGRTGISYCGRLYIHSAHKGAGLITVSNDLTYEYGQHTVRNKKLFTGACNAYTVYAKANSDMETFNPEVLNVGSGTQPIFRMCADIRHEGGAMLSPLAVNEDFERWYTNFVKEMQFQSAPIKFTGASGRLINEGQTYLSMNTKSRNFQRDFPLDGATFDEEVGLVTGQISGLANAAAGVINLLGGNAGGITQAIGGVIDFKWNSPDANTIYSDTGMGVRILNQTKANRKAAFGSMMEEEKMGMDLNNTYVAPQLKFQQSQTLRELVGNGFMIFKYQLSEDDLERCDKLLTMYGYRHSKTLEKTDLTNRPDFNYIEAGEVHINTSVAVPKWVREGAEDQMVGVRLWHKAFDESCYEDNE